MDKLTPPSQNVFFTLYVDFLKQMCGICHLHQKTMSSSVCHYLPVQSQGDSELQTGRKTFIC